MTWLASTTGEESDMVSIDHWGEQDSFSLETVYNGKYQGNRLHQTLFSPFLLIPVNKAYPEPVTLLVYFCFYIDFGETLMNSSF